MVPSNFNELCPIVNIPVIRASPLTTSSVFPAPITTSLVLNVVTPDTLKPLLAVSNPPTDTFFVKGGVAYVELSADESLGTGSKYGSEDILGGVIGIGAKSGEGRFEIIYTDYEDISLTSSVARTGVTTNNKIDAELDTLQFKYSYVF